MPLKNITIKEISNRIRLTHNEILELININSNIQVNRGLYGIKNNYYHSYKFSGDFEVFLVSLEEVLKRYE